jgi:hypothetical protein
MNMAAPHLDRKRILLVEDHVDNWGLVELNLAEYELICANDFNEGLRLPPYEKSRPSDEWKTPSR